MIGLILWLLSPLMIGALVGWIFSIKTTAFSRRAYVSIGILSGLLSISVQVILFGEAYVDPITDLTFAVCSATILVGIATLVKRLMSKASAPQSAT